MNRISGEWVSIAGISIYLYEEIKWKNGEGRDWVGEGSTVAEWSGHVATGKCVWFVMSGRRDPVERTVGRESPQKSEAQGPSFWRPEGSVS